MATITSDSASCYSLESAHVSSSSSSRTGATITVRTGDPRLGEDWFGSAQYETYAAYTSYHLKCPPGSTITAVDFTHRCTRAPASSGRDWYVEAYKYEYDPTYTGIAPTSGDWLSPTDLTNMAAANDLMATSKYTGTDYTVTGTKTFTGNSDCVAYCQAQLDSGTHEVQMVFVSSRHRLNTAITTTTNRYLDIEHSQYQNLPFITVTYTEKSVTGTEIECEALPSPSATGYLTSTSTVQTTMQSVSGGTMAQYNGVTIAGQKFVTPDYTGYGSMMEFDISGIPGDATIQKVDFDFYLQVNNSTNDFTMELYEFDWGANDTTLDWQGCNEIEDLYRANKMVCRYDSADLGAINTHYTTYEAYAVTLLQAAVDNGDTEYRTYCSSNQFRTGFGTANGMVGQSYGETSWSYFYWEDGGGATTSRRPRLIITYTLPEPINVGVHGAIF